MIDVRKTLYASALAATLILAPLAPANAGWADWTPRDGWCKIWPSFCR